MASICNQVKGTGLGGRITKNDVLAYIQKGGSGSQETGHKAVSPAVITQQGDQLIKHSIIRKSIAEHMLTSKRISPHVLTVMEADMSRVVAHRAANKEILCAGWRQPDLHGLFCGGDCGRLEGLSADQFILER